MLRVYGLTQAPQPPLDPPAWAEYCGYCGEAVDEDDSVSPNGWTYYHLDCLADKGAEDE